MMGINKTFRLSSYKTICLFVFGFTSVLVFSKEVKQDTSKVSITGTVTDIDGNVYNTIKIGYQWWTSENLKVTRYSNGDSIPHIIDDDTWQNSTSGAYCFYKNDKTNREIWGCLYNWYAVNDSRNIAPEGWHIPSQSDWQILADCLGGKDLAGGKLKDKATSQWLRPNVAATNESGFSALPAGFRNPDGPYYWARRTAIFWANSESTRDPLNAWVWVLHNDYSHIVTIDMIGKNHGQSVRCIKD